MTQKLTPVSDGIKSPVEFTAVLCTGKSGCGKSALMDALYALLNHRGTRKWILRAEMSEIIEWGRKLEDDLGKRLRESTSISDKGKFLPDELITELLPIWLEAHIPSERPKNIILLGSGFPRTVKQLQLLNVFEKSCVIHLLATDEVAHRSVIKRFHDSNPEVQRSDDRGGEIVFIDKMAEYNNLTLPAIQYLKARGDNVLELNRGELAVCSADIIRYLLTLEDSSPLSKRAAEKAGYRLRKGDHPVHDLFVKILNPRSTQSNDGPIAVTASPVPA